MSTVPMRRQKSTFGRRDAVELEQVLLQLREISDNLAYSEVGSVRGRDEKLLDALALIDQAVRSFVGLGRFWRHFATDPDASRRLRQAFAADTDPVAQGDLRRIAEQIAVPPMTAEESVARLRESISLLNRPLRLRARKRQGDLTAHDIRIAFAGMSTTATEAYEGFLEAVLTGAPNDSDREARKNTARRLLSALTVGATVLGTLSESPDTDVAGPVSAVWAEVAPEQPSSQPIASDSAPAASSDPGEPVLEPAATLAPPATSSAGSAASALPTRRAGSALPDQLNGGSSSTTRASAPAATPADSAIVTSAGATGSGGAAGGSSYSGGGASSVGGVAGGASGNGSGSGGGASHGGDLAGSGGVAGGGGYSGAPASSSAGAGGVVSVAGFGAGGDGAAERPLPSSPPTVAGQAITLPPNTLPSKPGEPEPAADGRRPDDTPAFGLRLPDRS